MATRVPVDNRSHFQAEVIAAFLNGCILDGYEGSSSRVSAVRFRTFGVVEEETG